ncbi:MAG: family 43 glycosylhydrolase, partial [Oscillospiraceae bacterium]|nr:family 43 glycosylhydrolase [Oscillospiraceae bacterium]
MKKIAKRSAAMLLTASLLTSAAPLAASAENPVVQTIYTADGAPMVWNDTFYLFTGHDEDNADYFTMNDWRCYSSKDMKNWTDLGVPLTYETFSWASGEAWASQCIERNGKF